MAVYTKVNKDDLSSFIKLYNIGEVISYNGITEGIENTNYLLETTKGKYILTLYEKRVNKDDLPFFMDLMGHLNNGGFKCPMPIKMNNGEVIGSLAKKPATIVSFLFGKSVITPNIEHCEKLGGKLAKLHIIGNSFKQKRANDLSLVGWIDIFNKLDNRTNEILPNMLEIMGKELDYLKQNFSNIITKLPKGICHIDAFRDNVFFSDNEIFGLIDFYFACSDEAYIYELAICLNAWCFENGIYDAGKANALFNGYNKVRKLNNYELQALPIMARGAVMRFLLSRVYDWFNTPVGATVVKKDPLEYYNYLCFHQDINDFSDYMINLDG